MTPDHPSIRLKNLNRKSQHVISTPRKFLFSTITFVVFFLVIELSLIGFGFSFRYSSDSTEQDHWFGLGFQQDPTLPWSWIPVPEGEGQAGEAPFQFNKLGFREPSEVSDEKLKDTLRIVCMGDSCTMGWEVLNQQTFCHVLKEILEKTLSITVETINAGIPGYTTFQGLNQLETRIFDLKPDVIIFSYCWNDHTFAIHMHETLDVIMHENFFGLPDKDLPGPTLSSKIHSSLSRLRSYQMMDFFVSKMRKNQTQDPGALQEVLIDVEKLPARVSVEDYKQNFKRMIKASWKKGIVPVLMNQPSQPIRSTNAFTELSKSLNYKAPNAESWEQFCRRMRKLFIQRQEEYNDAMMEVARTNNIAFVDMISVFKERGSKTELLIDPVHPTPKGHEMIAEELSKTIIDLLDKKQQPLP